MEQIDTTPEPHQSTLAKIIEGVRRIEREHRYAFQAFQTVESSGGKPQGGYRMADPTVESLAVAVDAFVNISGPVIDNHPLADFFQKEAQALAALRDLYIQSRDDFREYPDELEAIRGHLENVTNRLDANMSFRQRKRIDRTQWPIIHMLPTPTRWITITYHGDPPTQSKRLTFSRDFIRHVMAETLSESRIPDALLSPRDIPDAIQCLLSSFDGGSMGSPGDPDKTDSILKALKRFRRECARSGCLTERPR